MRKVAPFFVVLEVNNINVNKYKDIRVWFPIKRIDAGKIYLKGGAILSILKVEPINFKLKSNSEQIYILESYKRFLKSCNFDMQFIIQTDGVNLEEHINKIKTFQKNEPILYDMSNSYIELIENISQKRESISRKFYLIVNLKNNSNIIKIKECLVNCGNEVIECSKDEIIQILKRYFKKSSIIRKELKWA